MIPTIYVLHTTIARALGPACSQITAWLRRDSAAPWESVFENHSVPLGDQGTFELARRETCLALIAVSSDTTADFVIQLRINVTTHRKQCRVCTQNSTLEVCSCYFKGVARVGFTEVLSSIASERCTGSPFRDASFGKCKSTKQPRRARDRTVVRSTYH